MKFESKFSHHRESRPDSAVGKFLACWILLSIFSERISTQKTSTTVPRKETEGDEIEVSFSFFLLSLFCYRTEIHPIFLKTVCPFFCCCLQSTKTTNFLILKNLPLLLCFIRVTRDWQCGRQGKRAQVNAGEFFRGGNESGRARGGGGGEENSKKFP